MSEQTSIAPISVRKKMMTHPTLGAGSFLDVALELNPNRDVPYLYKHMRNPHGEVILKSFSLTDIQKIREKYSMWYWVNGIRAGDIVGVYVGDGVEPVFHYLAISALGAIPAMINDAMETASAKRYLDHIGTAGVVCDDPTQIAAAYREDPRQRPRFIVPASELHAYDITQGELPDVYPYQHAADDVVALIHSSGTTGTPKSTMLAHRQFWNGKETRMTRFPAEPYDRLMSLMPHTHAGGLSYFLTATLIGLPMIAMSDWTKEVVVPVMEAFQPTMMNSFPRTFVELATGELPTKGAAKIHTWFNTGDSAHYGHIRRLVSLGERPAGLIKPWLLPEDNAQNDRLPGSQFIDGLGSSEMGMALFGQVWTPESVRNDRCVGKPLAVVEEAAILDESGDQLGVGEVGMLAVRTPSRTPGYWNNDEMTRRFELADFWLTGDVARRDSEGRFYHLDRTSDVIETINGLVFSLEIEEVLLADFSDKILDCSVVGISAGDGLGQQPIAVVKLQPGEALDSVGEFLKKVNGLLGERDLASLRAMVIAETVKEFPTGVTGKVLKRELRTRHAKLLTPSNAEQLSGAMH